MRNRIRNILLEATAFKDMPNINDAFWKWFGDSVATDYNGDPKVFFHGTRNANFKQFKIRKPNIKGSYYRFMETGIWLTPHPEIATKFMRKKVQHLNIMMINIQRIVERFLFIFLCRIQKNFIQEVCMRILL